MGKKQRRIEELEAEVALLHWHIDKLEATINRLEDDLEAPPPAPKRVEVQLQPADERGIAEGEFSLDSNTFKDNDMIEVVLLPPQPTFKDGETIEVVLSPPLPAAAIETEAMTTTGHSKEVEERLWLGWFD